MKQLTIPDLQSALNEVMESQTQLELDTDIRALIVDSIDLGEILAILKLKIDLSKFKEVITAAEFLKVINEPYV